MITRKESITVLILTIVTITVALLPLIIGYLLTPSGSILGALGRDDEYVYVHYVYQAKQGAWLFHNYYTIEEHLPIFSLLPLLLIGKAAAIFNMNVFTAYNIGRVVFDAFFLFSIYYFIASIIKDKFYRMIAFLMVCFSGGLGWLGLMGGAHTVGGIFFFANYVTEAVSFPSLLFYPHFTFSLALMVLSFLFFLKGIEQKNLKKIIIAGVFGSLMLQSHPYEVVTMTVITFMYLFMQPNTNKEKIPYQWLYFGVYVLLLLPAIIYYVLLEKIDPIYQAWIGIIQGSPSFIDLLLTYGLLFIPVALSCIYLFSAKESPPIKRKAFIFLIIWAITALALVEIPLFSFRRRLIMGIHIPLAILGSIGTSAILQKVNNFKIRVMLAGVILLLLIPQSLYTIYLRTQELTVDPGPDSFYITKDKLALLQWLEKNDKSNKPVLSDPSTSLLIPPFTGKKIYLGYWANTINMEEKLKKSREFQDKNVDDTTKKSFLLENGIGYYLEDKEGKRINIASYKAGIIASKDRFNPAQKDYMKLTFENKAGAIYEITVTK